MVVWCFCCGVAVFCLWWSGGVFVVVGVVVMCVCGGGVVFLWWSGGVFVVVVV